MNRKVELSSFEDYCALGFSLFEEFDGDIRMIAQVPSKYPCTANLELFETESELDNESEGLVCRITYA